MVDKVVKKKNGALIPGYYFRIKTARILEVLGKLSSGDACKCRMKFHFLRNLKKKLIKLLS